MTGGMRIIDAMLASAQGTGGRWRLELVVLTRSVSIQPIDAAATCGANSSCGAESPRNRCSPSDCNGFP